MKTFRLLLVAIIFLYGSAAFSQTCQWANNIAGDSVRINSIAIDRNGNSYVVGKFDNQIVFNSKDSITVNEEGVIFIAKYNATGNCLWTKKISDGIGGLGSRIALDSIGNIFIASAVKSDTVHFADNFSLSDSCKYIGFLAKYDTSGNFHSASKIFSSPTSLTGMSSDPNGNVYILGNFSYDTISFGNGKSLIDSGEYKGFLVKFDANQQCVWAQKIIPSKSAYSLYLSLLQLDNAGGIYFWCYLCFS